MQITTTYREKNNGIQVIVSYKHNGKWKQKSKQGFRTQGEAKRYATKLLKEVMDIADKNLVDSSITFKELSKDYLEHLYINKSYNTYKGFESAFKKFSGLDSIPIKDIKPRQIQSIVNRSKKEGLSIDDYLKKLRTFFNWIIDNERIIAINPVPKRAKKVTPPKKMRLFTLKEMDDLIKNCENKEFQLFFIIASRTGMRSGEILGLTYDSFDFKKKTITIDKQWKLVDKNTYGFGSLKTTNSYRTIPLHKDIIKAINERPIPIDLSTRLFTFDRPNNIRIYFSYRNIDHSPHDFRHTFISQLVQNNLNIKAIAELVGDSIEMILKTYVHVDEEMMKAAEEKINQIF